MIQNEKSEPVPDVTVTLHYWATGSGNNPHLRANLHEKATTDKAGRWRMEIDKRHARPGPVSRLFEMLLSA